MKAEVKLERWARVMVGGVSMILLVAFAAVTYVIYAEIHDPCAEYVDVIRQETTTTGEQANVSRQVCLRWKAAK